MSAAPDLALVTQIATSLLGNEIAIERVAEGVSTFVYRIRRGDETVYLRILPEDASFAVEARVHAILRARGVLVPEVIHYEAFNPVVQKSIMLVGEITGQSVSRIAESPALNDVLREAGRQIALVNSVPVAGFGWIDRTSVDELLGERPTFRAFYEDDLTRGMENLDRLDFSHVEIALLRSLLEETMASMDEQSAVLVHGDFDVFHIYCDDGKYTGLIDLGEIMGNHRLYDLALMYFYDELPQGGGALDALLAGYSEIAPLLEDDLRTIERVALLFGVWKVGRELRKPSLNLPFIERLTGRLRAVLAAIQGTGTTLLS